jgi:hypothetical protein
MSGACPPPIVTLTMNPAIDVSAGVDYVIPDDKLRCATPIYEAGGGINVARAVRRHLDPRLAPIWADAKALSIRDEPPRTGSSRSTAAPWR